MEAVHVRIEFPDALNAKKEILSAEMSLLKLNQRVKEFQSLRNQEFKKKADLRAKLNNIVKKIVALKSSMPDAGKRRATKEASVEKIKQTQKNIELETELKIIQDKLARLNG